MRVASMIVVWVYILLATVLESVVASMLPFASVLRDTTIGVIAITMAAAVVVFYMELKYQPRWESLFLLVTLFFVGDLLFIWTASLTH